MLGTVIPLLASCGVDVDTRFGWVRSWFSRYQMADGGLNCDNDAYLVEGEIPSSIVGTVSPLEAMIAFDARRSDEESRAFLDAAGSFLVGRRLTEGSRTRHNAEERSDESDWLLPTFPRFYFYDVLRGLDALTAWADHRNTAIPGSAFIHVESALEAHFPDGGIFIGRRAWERHGTRLHVPGLGFTRGHAALRFTLLQECSRIGDSSPALTARWTRVRARLKALRARGLVCEG